MFFIAQLFWTFLPGGIANMAPVFVRKVNFLSTPIDFNKTIGGHPIFGKNKTWRGLIFGVFCAIVTVLVQRYYYPQTHEFALINLSEINPYYLGALFGVGALGGDLIKSFLKRFIRFSPGKPWPIADQIDWTIGMLALTSIVQPWSWQIWAACLIITVFLHPLINITGYALKMKDYKF